MRTILLFLLMTCAFLIPNESFGVNSIATTTNLEVQGEHFGNKEKNKKTLRQRVLQFQQKVLTEVLNPKKRKRKRKKGDRLKQYLWGYILTAVGALVCVILSYVFIFLLAEAGFILFFVFWILAILLSLASSVLFILWLIELTNRMD